MDIEVSVGLCVKNSEKTISDTVESILNQKYPQHLTEIIVIDGCSGDETLAIITGLLSKASILAKIISDNGRGLGAARQMVAEEAAGKYIMYVDSDVVLPEDMTQKQIDFLKGNPRVGVVVAKCSYEEGTLIATLENLANYTTCEESARKNSIVDVKAFGPFLKGVMCYRVEALKQAGGFDKHIKGASEDKDVVVRIQSKGWKLGVNQATEFRHNSRETWRDFWKEKKWYGYGEHYLKHKHYDRYPLWRNIPLISFIGGLKLSTKAYKLVQQKIAFLIPLHLTLGKIAWWYGFYKGNVEGYGHESIERSKIRIQ
jgi:glycosyltransferase involved in cell wall biosynthesis